MWLYKLFLRKFDMNNEATIGLGIIIGYITGIYLTYILLRLSNQVEDKETCLFTSITWPFIVLIGPFMLLFYIIDKVIDKKKDGKE